ncbi:MAG: hypothetical protein ACLTML_14690 [Blautia faecis]
MQIAGMIFQTGSRDVGSYI